MTQMSKIRLAAVADLNAAPLADALRRGNAPAWLEVRFLSQAGCADALSSGAVEAALLPVVEYQRIPDLLILPGPCIASPAGVRSVVLVCRGEPGSVRRIGLSRRSRTSVALLQVLLRRFLRIEAECEPVETPARDWSGYDALLLIGDEALTTDLPGAQRVDLAAQWHRFTGLPFVFAFWAVRGGVDVAGLHPLLLRCRAEGLARLPEIAADYGARLGLEPARLHEYLVRDLAYELGRRELDALKMFYELCVAEGVLPAARELEFAHVERDILPA
jgi:chorismate dehydratase